MEFVLNNHHVHLGKLGMEQGALQFNVHQELHGTELSAQAKVSLTAPPVHITMVFNASPILQIAQLELLGQAQSVLLTLHALTVPTLADHRVSLYLKFVHQASLGKTISVSSLLIALQVLM